MINKLTRMQYYFGQSQTCTECFGNLWVRIQNSCGESLPEIFRVVN